MSWYLQHLPPGVSASAYLDSQRTASSRADKPQTEQVPEPEPQLDSSDTPLKCSPLTDVLKICWQADWDQLTAKVKLTSAEGVEAQAQLTTVRPIGALGMSERAVTVQLLAALDVLKHVVYLTGWVTNSGRREKIGRVLG